MMVVADTGPIHYLVLIGAVGVLESLYGRVLAPQTVAAELSAAGTPVMIKEWMARPPAWFEVHADPDPPPGSKLSFLDPGERAAMLLAQSVGADRLLIDDWAGRAEPSASGYELLARWASWQRRINANCLISR